MNIKFSDSWLREFLKTEAKPKEIAKYLSLCSQSVEKLEKAGSDFVYDIEITTNRPDCMSVYGIARELSAILPRFGLKAELLPIPQENLELKSQKEKVNFEVEITKPSLCPRFTALIFDGVTIKTSPKFVQERLENAGIRSLNNVIDISNYLMIELGQPMHTFDFDKIGKGKMILRESKPGESIVTLDGQTRLLPPETAIIEEGDGRIIDLAGIMGGKNSEVDENTKRVLLFIQTYDPLRIRRTCQALSFRTDAASRFEKGVDPEGVMIAMRRATGLFKVWAGAEIASKLYDIYPSPVKQKKVTLKKEKLDEVIGLEIKIQEAVKILESLGFPSEVKNANQIVSLVPPWRHQDIFIPEDLVEEIARIYGYFNLPNVLPPISFPQKPDSIFETEDTLKKSLKYQGFIEVPTYSLVSAELLSKAKIDKENLLKLSNPLSVELLYLRTSLIPSLIQVISKNLSLILQKTEDNENKIRIFELSNIYISQGKDTLPKEIPTLTCLIAEGNFFELKGIVESIVKDLNIADVQYKKTEEAGLVNPLKTAEIFSGKEKLGRVGELDKDILLNFGVNFNVSFLELNLDLLKEMTLGEKKLIPIPKYPSIIEDMTFIIPEGITVREVIQSIKSTSSIIKSVNLIDSYDNSKTFRITFQSRERNLTDRDTLKVREGIIRNFGKFGAYLKMKES